MKKLKIIFAGTSYFSAAHLQAMIKSSYNVISIISQPDRPIGRGQKISLSPVKQISIKNSIPILQPDNLKDKILENKLIHLGADIMIVVSYGKIIPHNILDIFPRGCINVHASLLPRWRGATPIQSAILHGDKKTGISIIKMNEKIDHGTIIHSNKCNISSKDTTKSLSLKLIKIGIETLLEVLEKFFLNTINEKKQDETFATFCTKINKKDALLNWNVKAEKLERLIRAFNPWPVCYFIYNNKIIKVWKAQVIPRINKKFSIGEIICIDEKGMQINTSHQILNIKKLQFSGKRTMDIKDIMLSNKKIFNIGQII